jgi:uncharacterized protein YjbJ (UPF0337 family)
MTDRLDNLKDKAEGKAQEIEGEGKQAWGDATNDSETEGEGTMDELTGKAKQAMADIQEKAEGIKRSLTD